MRFAVAAMLTLLLGAFAAHFLLADRGYVLVNFRGFVVEMSVPGLVIVLVLLYVLVRALVGVADAPRKWRAAREQRQLVRRESDFTEGLLQLIEGNWARSERLLTHGLKRVDAPLANYLLAAHAAHLQGSAERRDQWLDLAESLSAEGATSAALTRAQLMLQAGETEAAIDTLTALEKEKGELPAAVALLARAYRALDDRTRLNSLLPRLPRAPLPAAERDELVQLGLQGELDRPDLTNERLAELWAALPNELRALPPVVAARARALSRLGRGEEAERELRAAVKREWHSALVLAYGEIDGTDRGKQLKQAETWLKNHADDAALLLTAARLAIASELWGKARGYLESSLALAPAPDAYALYGRLLSRLGEEDAALAAFRAGLGLVSPMVAEPISVPALVAPAVHEPERQAQG